MPRGVPGTYIKKAKTELGKGASWHDVFKRAWQLYKGSKVYKAVSGNPGKKGSRKKKSKSKRRVAYMPKKKRRYRRSMTIPLAPIAGFVAAPATQRMFDGVLKGDWEKVKGAMMNFVGMWSDGTWHFDELAKNITPIVVGLLVHKFVGGSPLNLNRTLARHKIPLIRI